MILAEFGNILKIWFKEFTALIFIAQIKICAIDHLEKEKREVKITEYTNISSIWSPSIFDNDRGFPSLWRKKLEIYQDGQRLAFITMMILWEKQNERQYL